MPDLTFSMPVVEVLNECSEICAARHHEFETPEHLLLALIRQDLFREAYQSCGGNAQKLEEALNDYLDTLDTLPEDVESPCDPSVQFSQVISMAYDQLLYSNAEAIEVPHILRALLTLKDSMAVYLLDREMSEDLPFFFAEVVRFYDFDLVNENIDIEAVANGGARGETRGEKAEWKSLVTCLNDHLDETHPLIGREAELERTIQVLCRKYKNNPLHVGEPGVGKTALVYGLAARIEKGKVPKRLKGARIYLIDLGTLLAGTQFRGDFEKRMKMVMDGLLSEPNAIAYIDEIHNLVGAGQTGEGSMDASNMLKRYLEDGRVRFIGSTTYQEFNRYFAKSRGMVRRFQQIDIPEPSQEEAVSILEGLKEGFEQFHGVTYAEGTMRQAVSLSAKYINERCLPDKAIDLIDEAGAYAAIHARKSKKLVDKALISEVLAKVCKVEMLADHDDDNAMLLTLEDRISEQIYGQDKAVRQVVEAVQMSKAGLTDEDKPMASLLFVGPTGVGKTEVARVLAREMGVELVRFDMSEYTEKHTVAKLIGSPAGYVGYDDGGLLTDAIRRSPDCVLLLDEIEKAHSDVFDILLQVMDYGVLTDNKGRKAYFHNVIFIMTSNAGAQYASQASLGFASTTTAGSAMLKQVKHTFKPEFLNRLNGIIVFNDMDQHMASLVLDKKLRELKTLLKAKNVTLQLSKEAHDFLLKQGYSKEYGAREMDRAIERSLKTVLMREILFGSLKDGGRARVVVVGDELGLKK